MLKVDSEKMKYEISGSVIDNLVEFAYLTCELINLYGEESVKKAFERGCDESLQENKRND